jgi:hypothetical protein
MVFPDRSETGLRGRGGYRMSRRSRRLPRDKLTVSVEDKQGNVMRVNRTFSVDAD